MSQISLPVSLGEAIDKLTILHIKMTKIQDSRRDDVQKEFDVLYGVLKDYVIKYNYHYEFNEL
jgi:predicted Holliday junction resolvase-like endonuclease